jgi:hypothetical protein
VVCQTIEPHLPVHGLRASPGTWACETYCVEQAQESLGHSHPATTLRHYVRLTTAARAKAVAGLDQVTRAALEAAQAGEARGRCSTTWSSSKADAVRRADRRWVLPAPARSAAPGAGP